MVSNAALTRLLYKRIRSSVTVWGVRSPLYSEPGSYSAKEMALARRLGNFRRWP
jgi:hypothetical protein